MFSNITKNWSAVVAGFAGVALVDRNARKHKTTAMAQACLEHLYSDEGLPVAGRNFHRPRERKIAAPLASLFPALKRETVDDVLGGWTKAQDNSFAEGGIIDQIFQH
jgi:ABC-type sulfate transport system substrate-binding protein